MFLKNLNDSLQIVCRANVQLFFYLQKHRVNFKLSPSKTPLSFPRRRETTFDGANPIIIRRLLHEIPAFAGMTECDNLKCRVWHSISCLLHNSHFDRYWNRTQSICFCILLIISVSLQGGINHSTFAS